MPQTTKVNGNATKKQLNNNHSTKNYNNDHFHEANSNDEGCNKNTYEFLFETAKFLSDRVPFKPTVGIICGSGLGGLATNLTKTIEFEYKAIPHFPPSTVKGHEGKLVFGYLDDVAIVCMQGRLHYYEGYPLWKCAMPVRVMKLLGVTHMIISNAAGGLNPKFKVGDIMLVKDHINMMGFAGNNPLLGPNDERFGPRFPPMNKAYDRKLIDDAKHVCMQLGLGHFVHEGVYTCLGGPNFETVAELRMLQMVGADAVGMSTVHEVITARHCDMDVLVFSLITNIGVTDYDNENMPHHEEVMDVGRTRQADVSKFVVTMIKHMTAGIK